MNKGQSSLVTKTILIVEDEADLVQALKYNLEREGCRCRCVNDGQTALAEIRRERPDLVLLDRMLPGASGDDIAAQLRRDARTASIPIIMLTAKAEEADELVGFALGADDYVSKPFSMKVLIARIGALFRRASAAEELPDVIERGVVRLDRSRHEVTVNNHPIQLTATEFRILHALMQAGGRVLARSRMLDMVLGTGVGVTERTVDVHITALRKKLGEASSWVQTIRGVGYAFREPT